MRKSREAPMHELFALPRIPRAVVLMSLYSARPAELQRERGYPYANASRMFWVATPTRWPVRAM